VKPTQQIQISHEIKFPELLSSFNHTRDFFIFPQGSDGVVWVSEPFDRNNVLLGIKAIV
jgi:hypothetical protein